ncbi:MAG TPA: ATP-dependent DNA helicase UvrD2 [Acidimicrobiales bacterium]|nr:ATP-dependent DNA helicase UvrD2 [Acidimicrobiales bacterium]
MDPAAALAGLDDEQRRAATSPATPLAVVAPAGSGKTRVLTARVAHRIATGEIEPSHVLCVTFTRKAAGELRQRLQRIGIRDRIEAGTFHAVAWRQLRDRWAAQGRSAPQLLDRVQPFLREQLEVTARAQLSELAGEITWARARMVRPEQYVEAARIGGRRTKAPAGQIAERFAAYEQAKSRAHVVDFDDLLAACAAAIEGDPAFAAAQRWRFRHLFVDEFQDVNPLQLRLLEAWRGDRWDVFVVGDTHQSIYGWNGADPTLLDELAARWPALETIHLDRTHRSTPQITAAAASVIAAAGLPDRHPESTGAPGPPARCLAHADEVEEVRAIARAIRRRRGADVPWKGFAVLARTHERVIDLDRGLAALGVPTRLRRQASLLDDPTVRRVLFRMRGDDRPVLTALGEALADEGDELEPAVEALADAAGAQRTRDDAMTGRSFVGWAHANLTDDDHEPDAVTISTIHAAKGLEWPVVHVASCEDGSIPIASARRREARAEEARLLYVAITRAEREVTLHWARQRTIRNVTRPQVRSPFLDGFEERVAAVVEPPVDRGARQLADLRSRFGTPAAPDPVLSALRAWRTNRARAARTEPATLLPDDVLGEIAARRPRSRAELDAIPGLGAARRHRYAAELLAVVARVERAS